MITAHHDDPSICFVGLANLPALAREYGSNHIGGAEVQQTLLARALARRGFDVSMVVANYGQPDGATWDGVRTYRAYRFHEGIPVFRFIHPRWTAVWSALKRADADVYYVSGAGLLPGIVGAFARRYGRKVMFRAASISDCSPKTLRLRFARDRYLYRYGLRRVDLALAQTAEQQQLLYENYGLKSTVVASMCDAAGVCRPFAERDCDVLWVGNIRKLKRPDLLLDLARRMPQRSFEMVGGPMKGSLELFAQIEAEAATLPNVRFRGHVPYHEMRDLFERARVLAATSEIEGFPNTYLQAWSHGMPVVGFLDPEHMIANGRLGRAVRTPDEMAAAVAELLADEAEWSAASQRCRAFAAGSTDENAMLAPYVEALRSVGRSHDDGTLALRPREH
jgi:glycosyltransferase involved in cell wall biosynthesis